ncbi:hypothetical protein [Algoriphagus antarcticus]|uniref:Uncharacterized protein n=1 Tax=Algoriphagus antarcticus TaxID=238540 RepID=A0A3E0DYZ4_9BACT|nr:hypothetical protein [Algoriphagus antarcticus]REG90269.1 hypothetical protein C8N25_1076 [Algoriphagus antarcticus]
MANYTFLPFLRRGIVGLLNSNVEKDRLTIPLRLQVIGEGETLPPPIEHPIQLLGPGDITGLNHQAIVRTVPRAGVNDFEANFLAAIEFYDEDFTWRYSPLIPDSGKLAPWIWLIVLTENEYLRVTGVKGKLPAIDITSEAMLSAFPAPETTASWAHVHLNFEPEGSTAKALGSSIQQNLNQNPNLGCSRLICPKHLRANTSYRGFLIPAFEKGRKAGLGHPEADVAASSNSQISWASQEGKLAPNRFPVYYEWPFSTSLEGDFVDLARRLSPLTIEEQNNLAAATKLLDIRDPGWGIRGAKGIIRLESALKLPGLPPDSANELDDKKLLGKKIGLLLNLGIVAQDSAEAKGTPHPYFKSEDNLTEQSNLDDDPIITPPIYGGFYRPGQPLSAGNSQSWYEELNLNPVYRVAAAVGTGVVQKDQEELMDIAWEQWGTYADTRKIENRWLFSEQLSKRMGLKRIQPMVDSTDPVVQYRATGFFSPLIPTIKKDGTTTQKMVKFTTANAAMPSTFSSAFLKVTRKGGPLMRRFEEKPKGTFFAAVKPLVLMAAMPTTAIQGAANAILFWLNSGAASSEHVIKVGLGGIEPLKSAMSLWLPYVSMQRARVEPRNDLHKSTMAELWVQISPENTIMSRFKSMMDRKLPTNIVAADGNKPPAPVFREATYARLAERNTDFILPGLEKIPQNRVAILKANNKFIESYLVGLNHEMAHEFLWREFPAPLNATYFSQFWDVRNSTTPKQDIQPIQNWKSNSKIGKHGIATGQAGSEDPMVVVIRGDLLRKYPNTEIFMARSTWDNKKAGSHKLVLDVNEQSKWVDDTLDLRRPIFSARIEPDYTFLGFNLGIEEVRGNAEVPGWFFVLKERTGDTNFGMDLVAEPSSKDPSWDLLTEVTENQCIQIESDQFKTLPRSGKRADQVASMLYQRPFMLFVHAGRLLPDFI